MSQSTMLAPLPDLVFEEPKPSINLRFGARSWAYIGLATLLLGLLGTLMTVLAKPNYASTRTVLVTAGSNPTDNETLVQSFAELMTTRGFAAELKDRSKINLPVETILGMIGVDRQPSSAVLVVKVTSPSLTDADAVSQQVVPTLRDVIEENQRQLPIEQRIPGPIVQELFKRPIREKVFTPWYMGFLAAGALGFLASFGFTAFRHYRKPVLGSARDVGDALDLPVLARLPAVGDGRGVNPQDAVLGMLAAIERLGAQGPIHRLVVVGPESDVERSKLILALSCAIARNFDQPVALVDADLENASLTRLIGADDEPGLAECLTAELRVDQTLLRLENGHTPTLFTGMVPPSGMVRVMPAGLNRSGSLLRMRSNLHQVLGALSGRYVVIVDGPQVPGPVPSTQLLSLSDATLVVVSEGSTSVKDARFTADALRSYTTNPVGAIVIKK